MALSSPFVVRVEEPIDCLDEMMRGRQRSIEEALADLRAKYETRTKPPSWPA